MPEFFVETYHPTLTTRPDEPGPSDVALAADELNRDGRPVSLVRAILVPEDETCFYLFEASNPESALDSVARSGLSVLRVLPASSIWVRPDAITTPSLDLPTQGGPSLLP